MVQLGGRFSLVVVIIFLAVALVIFIMPFVLPPLLPLFAAALFLLALRRFRYGRLDQAPSLLSTRGPPTA
ncbi:MAG TPA: hypothetical protein VMW69_04990 [Spirochaetia bacterium]|nr:hypothetical protein [Spirochaetia bacterium]